MNNINGFKVISETWINSNNCYKCIAICKVCGKEFKTNFHALHRMKSCGCARARQLKPLPKFINGFKAIKCHGYNKVRGVRWATVECKVCKKEYEVDPNKLKYRKHCGCMRKGVIANRFCKKYPRLVQCYKHMKKRCYDKNNKDYYNYGAKGIFICKEWLYDSNTFCEWSLKNGYKDDLTIDRINGNKEYSPENCRWADSKTQGRNTNRNVLTMELADSIRKDRLNMTYKQLINKYNVSRSTIYLVVKNFTWS